MHPRARSLGRENHRPVRIQFSIHMYEAGTSVQAILSYKWVADQNSMVVHNIYKIMGRGRQPGAGLLRAGLRRLLLPEHCVAVGGHDGAQRALQLAEALHLLQGLGRLHAEALQGLELVPRVHPPAAAEARLGPWPSSCAAVTH
jgi:hypothetical protein